MSCLLPTSRVDYTGHWLLLQGHIRAQWVGAQKGQAGKWLMPLSQISDTVHGDAEEVKADKNENDKRKDGGMWVAMCECAGGSGATETVLQWASDSADTGDVVS